MEQDAQRIFYTSIDADIPYQKQFFWYDPEIQKSNEEQTPVLVWWVQENKLSYEEWLDASIIRVLNLFSVCMQYIPFVEQVFVGWWVTFGETSWVIDLVVVSNTQRTWLVKTVLSLIVVMLNIYASKNTPHTLRLSLVVDRVRSDCSWIRLWVWDLMSPYRIAHLTTLYEQYEHWSSQFFKANAWIQYTLPFHPLYSVITLWIQRIYGSSRIRRVIESLFSWTFGDILNGVFFQLHLLFSNKAYRYDKTLWASPWVGWETIKSRRSLLKRKVSKKQRDS
jgi:hypothetical protein